MKKSKPRSLQAWKLVLGVVAAACARRSDGRVALGGRAGLHGLVGAGEPRAGRQLDLRRHEPGALAGRSEPVLRLQPAGRLRRARPLGLDSERRRAPPGERR